MYDLAISTDSVGETALPLVINATIDRKVISTNENALVNVNLINVGSEIAKEMDVQLTSPILRFLIKRIGLVMFTPTRH